MKPEDKIAFMHERFGSPLEEETCAGCCNLRRWTVGEKKVFKCQIYGASHSSATDWSDGFIRCGMYGRSQDGIGNLYKQNKVRAPAAEKPLPGQIELHL